MRDADAEIEIVAALAPRHEQLVDPPAHRDRHPHRALGRVRHRHRVVEEDHHPVAGEPFEGALVLQDGPSHRVVILAQDAHDLLGLGRLGEGREPAEVEEDHGDLAAVALQRILGHAAHDQLR